MSANPIDSTNTDKPTGSLEDLFRHHLAEAAVPPRPMVWEQIDNSLLQRQNEQYRRRLSATRWVAAASIAIASLTGAGWWASRDALQHDRADLAAATQRTEVAEAGQRGQSTGQISTATANSDATRRGATATAAGRTTKDGTTTTDAGYATAATDQTVDQRITGQTNAATEATGSTSQSTSSLAAVNPAAARQHGNAAGQFLSPAKTIAGSSVAAVATAGARNGAGNTLARPAAEPLVGTTSAQIGAALAGVRPAASSNAGIAGLNAGIAGLTSSAARNAVAATVAGADATTLSRSYTSQPEGLTAAASNQRMTEELALLASRTTALNLSAATALPTGFTTVEVPADGTPPATPPARKWQFGASYVAGVFNPNINFSRAGGDAEFDYNPALGPNSPALSEAAAAEYRENLRPGFSQRLSLRATRRLVGHWSLSTGAEVAQSRASSASSLAFVGEQVPDFGQSVGGPMRTTNFRYQTAGIPVELRYTNPVKRGLSIYGRVGAAVSALLRVRAEVEGIPEATRSYSIAAEGPYRRVLTNLRGGLGAQYRPTTGHWTVSLGPTAELGLVSLNAHPAQGLSSQSRAYSLGLEAGVEFGRAAK
jgi:hypothetical protein